MIRSIVALLACAMTLGLSAGDAEAKRFGGSKSFGMQRSAPTVAPKAPTAAPKAAAGPNTAPKRNSWLGPIAGLAAGLGLAALFSHLGLGEELGSLLLIALLAFAAFALFRRFSRASQSQAPHRMQYAGPTPTHEPQPMSAGSAAGAPVANAEFADFDQAGFVRQAKINFIRMQAAYDAGNLDDIRAFTTPDVFAEVKMQLDERADTGQQTDVIDLTGDIVEVVREGERYIVSVRFHGLIREERGSEPQPFDEIWHLTKPVSGDGGWLVSGIQQAH
ncbi:Tim44 domain-containing protein [Denitromonas iodatirespirans]|uniref:Tim44 domain-containing protein n=1 Tax=Denitromonas iodatirespirans TaxID=2795389 RepID=A0A944D982_DENI1|nr:Tim44-like domain-containing protein [Denitromonas iodatirespirans]MBT0962135.1 Tim44 domain-containing protein [Denitromonas iodatirespirans]